ncbi:hypothetical protein [Pseudomonas sp. CGJS7]|uniref:hypothetical protein n=1 Tax=Pseudomonas sp. CGJS7 TaxID=3109348 RepID=UPI0030095458
MNENLRCLLHEELESLLDPPSARPQRITRPAPAAGPALPVGATRVPVNATVPRVRRPEPRGER